MVPLIRDGTAKPDGWGMDYEVDMVPDYDVNDIYQVNYSNMLQYRDHSGAGIFTAFFDMFAMPVD